MELTTACVKSVYAPNASGYPVRSNPWSIGKSILHHRFIYLLANKLHPRDINGLLVRHKCDNRMCINPEHLELGTNQDNMDDMWSRGRGRRAVGIDSGMAKVTEAIVKAMRHEYKTSTLATIAVKYNISKSNVAFIVNRKTWKHVD